MPFTVPRPAVLEFPCAYRGRVGVWFDRLRVERRRGPGMRWAALHGRGRLPRAALVVSRPLPGADLAGAAGRGPPARRAAGSHARVRRHAPALLPALARPRRSPRPDAALHRPVPVPRERPALEPASGVPAAVRCPSPRSRSSAATPPTTCSSCSRSRRPGSPPTDWRAVSPGDAAAAVVAGVGFALLPARTGPLFGGHPAGFAMALVPGDAVGARRGAPGRTARGRRGRRGRRSSRWPCWSRSTRISPSGSRSRTRPCA